jgi:hypothetical protein
MNVEKNGVIYFTKKNKGEVNNVYFDRINSVAEHKPVNITEFNLYKKKYEKDCNIKYLKCVY